VEGGYLAELVPAAREALASLGSHRRYEPGQPLFIEGDLGGNVLILQSGFVKVFSSGRDGASVLLAVRGPGEVLGDLSAIDNEPRSASGTALGPVVAQVITADDFRIFLTEIPGAGFALLRLVVRRMRDSDRLRVEFGERDALGRVAMRLVELSSAAGERTEEGIRITVPLTQDDLAAWVASSRESVARALASLRKRGLITTARREITVLDVEGLQRAADHD
jgi:CRP-like cAMP-binding protein